MYCLFIQWDLSFSEQRVTLQMVSFRVKVWVTCIVFYPMGSFVLRVELHDQFVINFDSTPPPPSIPVPPSLRLGLESGLGLGYFLIRLEGG